MVRGRGRRRCLLSGGGLRGTRKWEVDGEVGGVDRGLVGVEDCDYYDASAVKGGSIEVLSFWDQRDSMVRCCQGLFVVESLGRRSQSDSVQ